MTFWVLTSLNGLYEGINKAIELFPLIANGFHDFEFNFFQKCVNVFSKFAPFCVLYRFLNKNRSHFLAEMSYSV